MQSWITGDIFTKKQKMKSLKAWEPWDYTVSLLFTLQNSDIGEDFPEWRLNWFTGVVMLRTIGHVLDKVDTKESPRHLAEINNIWQLWRQHKDENWIFFDFIEKERNNILKEFSFGAGLPQVEDNRLLAYGNTDLDAAQLFREAVYWWRYQLETIEDMIG